MTTLAALLLLTSLSAPAATAAPAAAAPPVAARAPGQGKGPAKPAAQGQAEAPAASDQAPAAPRASAEPAEAERVFTEADLAPILNGDAVKAVSELEAGRYEAALQGLSRDRTPEARYVRGVALVGAQRGPEAVKALEGLEAALPELADRVAFWRGRAQDAAGEHRRAAEAYAAVTEGSLLWPDAQLSRARALERAGDRDGALEALAPILSLPPPDEITKGDPAADALLLTGQLRAGSKAKGDQGWARRAFLECWAGHPLSGEAATCRAELKKLPGAAGAPPSAEETLRRAEVLLDANRNPAALADLEPLVARLPAPGAGEPLSCRAAYALGRAQRREREHTKAMGTLRPVVEGCEDAQLRVKALYVLAGSASIVAQDQGVAWYRALARDYPAHPFADDALFYAADLLARAGHPDEALAALADLSEKYPKGDFRPEALFRMAWLEHQGGFMAGALASLSRIERDYEAVDPYEHARAVYWKARFLAERGGEGDLDRARDAYRLLVERYPADYYGLLARARLEEAAPGSAPAWGRPAPEAAPALRYHPGPLEEDRHFRAGVKLLRMGLEHPAADELASVDRKSLAATDPLLLTAELLDRAGDHKTAHGLVRTLGRAALRQRPEGANLRVWRVAYPQAYRADVDRWAPPAGVAPDLLLALMREESGLDPTVVSGAGAVGLTQLMLPTAQAEAKKLKMGRIRQADLMRPPVAIRIGASYFGGLMKRYQGSEAIALAAYNVGDVPVKNWLRARGNLPLDAFVEEIPVQETRGYVKRVLRSYAAYRFLYGGGADRPLVIGQALPVLADR